MLLHCGQLVLPGRDSPMSDVVVEVTGGVISDVRRSSPGREAVDLSGATVMPGFVDAHTHFCRPDDSPSDLIVKGMETLAAGFTTIRDLGSPGDVLLRYRRHLASTGQLGPRVLTCGRILSAPSPGSEMFGDMYRTARSEEQFRDAVAEEAERGIDVVKVMVTGALTVPEEDVDPPQISEMELRAVVEESHRRKIPVAAHAEGLEGIAMAVDAGVDTVEHGEKGHQSEELLKRMAAAGIILVPTLAVFGAVANSDADRATRQRAGELGEHARRTVAAARSVGVPIAVGPDGVHPQIPAGSQAIELRLLAEAGLTPPELVHAATSSGAGACRLQASQSGIDVGHEANLVALSGNPFVDPEVLWSPPALVVRAGQVAHARAVVPPDRRRADRVVTPPMESGDS